MKRILPFLLLAFACSKDEKTEDSTASTVGGSAAIYLCNGERDSTFALVNSDIYRLSINDANTAQFSVNGKVICLGPPLQSEDSIAITNTYPSFEDTTIAFFEIYESPDYWYVGTGPQISYQNTDTLVLVGTDTILPFAIPYSALRVFIFEKFEF
jgi:hypothetical protein